MAGLRAAAAPEMIAFEGLEKVRHKQRPPAAPSIRINYNLRANDCQSRRGAAARSLPNFKPDATGFLGFTTHARAMRLASFRAAP
jgi:hypothetical protein